MFDLQKTKILMLYSLFSFCLTVGPALAQGEKIVEDDQAIRFITNISTGSSVLGTALTFVHFIITKHLAKVNSDYSVINSSLLFCSSLVAIVLLSSFVIDQFVPIFAYAITVNCILIMWGLTLRLIRP